jgi:hypothetical protein
MKTIRISPFEQRVLLDAIECLIEKEQDSKSHTALTKKILESKIDYEKAYNIVAEFFDFIPYEEKNDVHKQLCRLGL